MTKWEYMLDEVELRNSRNDLIAVLNRHGRNGWELATCIPLPESRLYFFKREKRESQNFTPVMDTGNGLAVARGKPIPVDDDDERFSYYEDDDADRWHDTWQKVDEYMRDQ